MIVLHALIQVLLIDQSIDVEKLQSIPGRLVLEILRVINDAVNKVDLPYARVTFWKYLCEMPFVTQTCVHYETLISRRGYPWCFLAKNSYARDSSLTYVSASHSVHGVPGRRRFVSSGKQTARTLLLAHLITRNPWNTSHYSLPVLINLRWHPVKSRIVFT